MHTDIFLQADSQGMNKPYQQSSDNLPAAAAAVVVAYCGHYACVVVAVVVVVAVKCYNRLACPNLIKQKYFQNSGNKGEKMKCALYLNINSIR